MNQIAILAPGGQTLTVSGLMMNYQVVIMDPSGTSVPIIANGPMPLPPLPFGQVYMITVQGFGAPPVNQINGIMTPKASTYSCVAGGPIVVTITIN